MNILRHRAIHLTAAGIVLAAGVVGATVPAQAQRYLRAAPYGAYYGPYGYYIPYNFEYYLPSDQHRFYDRSSTDFNS